MCLPLRISPTPHSPTHSEGRTHRVSTPRPLYLRNFQPALASLSQPWVGSRGGPAQPSVPLSITAPRHFALCHPLCSAHHVSLSRLSVYNDRPAGPQPGPFQQPRTPTGLWPGDLHLRPSPGAGGGPLRAPQPRSRAPKTQPPGPLPKSGECHPLGSQGENWGQPAGDGTLS